MDEAITTAVVCSGVGFIGVALALLVAYMYENGIILDEFVTGSISIPDLQAGIIIIFLIFAVLLGVIRR